MAFVRHHSGRRRLRHEQAAETNVLAKTALSQAAGSLLKRTQGSRRPANLARSSAGRRVKARHADRHVHGEARDSGGREARRHLTEAVSDAAGTFTELLGAFFSRAGMSQREVAATFRRASRLALTREMHIDPDPPQFWRQVADAVTRWWRDPDYLDEDGLPRELREYGPAPSLESLLASTVDADRRREAKALLRRTAATVQRGAWRFRQDGGFLRLAGHHSVERLLIGTSGMFTTFLDNQLRRRDPLITKNFDRTAHVAEYPVALIPELRAKVIKRLQPVLEDVDGILMAAEKKDVKGPVALVGVTMFMHTSTPRPRGKGPESSARTGAPTSGTPARAKNMSVGNKARRR